MRGPLSAVLLVTALNFASAQKIYLGVNLSFYSSHFKYNNSPLPYQKAYTPLALFPNSGISIGYKFDKKNSGQLNYTFQPYNLAENYTNASKFPSSGYLLVPVAQNFNLRYIRELTEIKLFKKDFKINAVAGIVVQLNARPDTDTVHFWPPPSNQNYTVYTTTSKTLFMSQVGMEGEWVFKTVTVILGFNWYLGSAIQTETHYVFLNNGQFERGYRYGDGFGRNITIGLRWYFRKKGSHG